MKKNLIALFLFFSVFMLTAQNQPSVAEIQSSGNYLYGIGQADEYRQADNNALDHLITQITVQVESYFVGKTTEVEGTVEEFAQSVVKTYSNVSLISAKSVLISDRKGKYEVMRYISLREMEQVYANRKNKIIDFVQAGIKAENDLRIGDALKNYYWGLLLLQSHKDRDAISCDFPDIGNRLLMSALPELINNVFTYLNFEVKNTEWRPTEKYKAFYLQITYNGKPVDNLDFTFWTGRGYSNPVSVRSGLGLTEFYDMVADQPDKIKLAVEYAYENKSSYDLEVNAVFQNMRLPYFDRSEFVVSLAKQNFEAEPQILTLETQKIDFEKLNKVEQSRNLRKSVIKVVNAIEKRNYGSVKDHFTDKGWLVYNELIANGNVKILPFVDTLKVIQMDGAAIVRAVPMRFSFKNNSRDFIEQVVFTFDQNQKIDAISFAISDKAIEDIVSRSHRFGTVEDKYQLIDFLEHYKTAYCLKRLDYIESIFADNALIIVGN
ncbi:MAG: LPP20 family lipoprotein, partial [Bacteroidales bacterium]|nr:LPP20 family lipoprotein [Bacteroidales bacterium]